MSRQFVRATYKNAQFSSSLQAAIQTLDEQTREKVFRPAVYEGVSVIYSMLRAKAPTGDATMSKTPGLLRDSIYRFHHRGSTEERQAYWVGINMKKAPHWHLVEYGHSQPYLVYRLSNGEWRTNTKVRLGTPRWVPAYPFIRQTFLAGTPMAVQAMRAELKARIQQSIRASKVTA